MEEERGSAATELPMCNIGKQTLVGDFGVVRDEIYMKIKVQ